MICDYNKKIAALPPGPNNPTALSENIKHYLDNDSSLVDLERFLSNERWAREPGVRRAMWKLKEFDRSLEEVKIISLELCRFINAQRRSLEIIQQTIPHLESSSPVHDVLLEMGAKCAMALRQTESKALKKHIDRLLKRNPKYEKELKELLGPYSINR